MSDSADNPPLPPLAGIRVLDLATFLAGPFCAATLAEFGAEVIKVEQPGIGDPARRFGSPTPCGDTLPFLGENRNKTSLTLNLKTPEGADLLKRLVAGVDVVVENFQPGTLEGWGLGWDVLSQANPRLVMLRISGYGQTGPYRGRPGFGRIANAFGGLAYLAGWPDRAPVTPGSATIPDYLAGLYGVMGILMALRARDRDGIGQQIDIGLYEPVFRILDELAGAFQQRGYVRERMGPGTVNVCPHSHYPTADGCWVAIACTSDKIFERLAQAMGRPDLARADAWGTTAARLAAREAVDELVGAWTSAHDRDAVLAACEAAQVPCGPVASIAEIFADPQVAARGNIRRIDDPRVGETVAIADTVPRLTRTPGAITGLGPALGADTDRLLSGLLGLDAGELARLRALGAI